MKTLFLADLHHEFWDEDGLDPLGEAADLLEDVEAVILAGDLANKPKVRWAGALAYARSKVPGAEIFVFPGNHDYYQSSWFDREERLAEVAAENGARFVQDTELRLGDARVLCSTLWTDMALDGEIARNVAWAERSMNDYRLIRSTRAGYRRIDAGFTMRRHQSHRAWLEERLASPLPEGTTHTVVVTHHAPHPAVLPDYKQGAERATYASDLSDLIKKHELGVWLHGHAHDSKPMTIGNTQIRCCSLGYPPVADTRQRISNGILDLSERAPSPTP